jgi:hypothetical protein
VDTRARAVQHEILLKTSPENSTTALRSRTYTQPTLLDQAADSHKETLHNYTAPLCQGRGRHSQALEKHTCSVPVSCTGYLYPPESKS